MDMPSIDDVFGGTTIKSEDIKGKNPVVTIENVVPKDFTESDGKTKKKLMITFVGAKKALVCNVTNARRIAHLYGNDYSDWKGRKIKLQVEMVDFGGRVMDGIRVFSPMDTSDQAPKKRVFNDTDMPDNFDNEAPF